jgi:hypothetical protein
MATAGRWGAIAGAAAMLGALALAAPPASACGLFGSRPGTPTNVSAIPLSSTSAKFIFTHTTGKSSACCHQSYIDVSVSFGGSGGATPEHDVANRSFPNTDYGKVSEIEFHNLKEGFTYCFKAWARTSPNGCRSQMPSGDACVNLPPRAVDDICQGYKRKALEQAERIRFMQQQGECRADPNNGRWSGFGDQHYTWCVAQAWAGEKWHEFEVNERERILTKVCKPLRPGKSSEGEIARPPDTKPGFECRFGVQMRLSECTNAADGSETQNWDYKGLSPVCGLGKDEDEAQASAIATYAGLGITVREDPNWGECGFQATAIPYCSCDPGAVLGTRSYGTKPKVGSILKKPSDLMKVDKCFSNMVRTAGGRCACKPGTKWRGIRCEAAIAIPAGPYRTPGDVMVKPGGGLGAIVTHCRWPRPVGRWPKCCPYGTQYRAGACRRAFSTREVPRPKVTPRPLPIPRPAPGGPVSCPAMRPVGTPPYCCPSGTRHIGGMCRRIARPVPGGTPPTPGGAGGGGGPVSCPPTRPVGRPPYCCPTGMRYLGGACRRPTPTPLPAPSGGGTIPGSGAGGGSGGVCPPGRPVGRPPYCCPAGSRYERGACRK